jgi:hypothetical protein
MNTGTFLHGSTETTCIEEIFIQVLYTCKHYLQAQRETLTQTTVILNANIRATEHEYLKRKTEEIASNLPAKRISRRAEGITNAFFTNGTRRA